MKKITHKELVLKAEKWLKRNGFPVTINENIKAVTEYKEQPDVLGFNSSTSILLEIKVSRSDFLKDYKKPFRISPEKGVGEWRFFVCPKGLIEVSELPKGWGLIIYDKKIKPIHGWKTNITFLKNKPFKANKEAERSYMYSMLRRNT